MTMTTRETADRIAKLFLEYETYAVDPDDVVSLATDYIALLDELAAAREVIATIVTGAVRSQPDHYEICQIDYDAAYNYLSATEDADDRTT